MKETIELKYGGGKIIFSLEQSCFIQVLSLNENKTLNDPEKNVLRLLDQPTSGPSLNQLIVEKRARKVLIIVNDITRPTPYQVILPPLLKNLEMIGIKKENITFIVATGSHRGNSIEENLSVFGEKIFSAYPFQNHSCDDPDLLYLGKMKSGNDLYINKIVNEVDFIIATGVIVPHYIAGFSGGRKSILPGICGRKTIENNHANMVHTKADTGQLMGNPVHLEMLEAATRVGVDFIINTITGENGEIIDIVTGHLVNSWLKGVEICQKAYFVPIKQLADVVIVSAGGFPKDINIYQSQKALENAAKAVKPGGIIVLIAECRDGFGNSIFEDWIKNAESLKEIENRFKERFVLGGHKAYAISKVAKENEIVLISALHPEETEKLFMKHMENMEEVFDLINQKYKNHFSTYVIPNGSTVVPYLIR